MYAIALATAVRKNTSRVQFTYYMNCIKSQPALAAQGRAIKSCRSLGRLRAFVRLRHLKTHYRLTIGAKVITNRLHEHYSVVPLALRAIGSSTWLWHRHLLFRIYYSLTDLVRNVDDHSYFVFSCRNCRSLDILCDSHTAHAHTFTIVRHDTSVTVVAVTHYAHQSHP